MALDVLGEHRDGEGTGQQGAWLTRPEVDRGTRTDCSYLKDC